MNTVSKITMIRSLLLTFVSVAFFGCVPGGTDVQAVETQNSSLEEKLLQAESIDELIAYDEQLTSQQIQMMTSDDSQYDIEDANEKASQKNKILIVGDSWAMLPCLMGSMNQALKSFDAPIINDLRCLRTSKAGAEAHEWIELKNHTKTIEYIKNNSRIKMIYLSLGGNDLIAQWNVNYTPAMEEELFNQVLNNIRGVMQAYVSVRPDIKIILSGYDFPNFSDKNLISVYKKKSKQMGNPTPQELNQALIRFSQYMIKITDNKNFFYIHHLGLSHYLEGVPEYDYPAQFSLHPDKISPMNSPADVGGNPDLPTSRGSLMKWMGLVQDAFHLKKDLFLEVMKHTYRNVILNI